MKREDILASILISKIVAIIRLDNAEPVHTTALALHSGGVPVIEVTMGTPNALQEIYKLSQIKGVLPGVGSVINQEQAIEAVKAGAQFIVTPASKSEIISTAHELGKPVFSGALTPTEILQAYEWGADVVKLFPASTFGMSYFKAVKAPMPQIPMMPTGGVTIENAKSWIDQGAVCLGVGSTLVNKDLIAQGKFDEIAARAKEMRAQIKS